MADAERLRGELYAAFKNRALMYWHVFDELRKALGEPQPGREGCCHLHVRPGRAH